MKPAGSEASIPLAAPDITDQEIAAVTEVLRSGQLSCGPWIPRFERQIASTIGLSHAVAVANGTCALHLIFKGLGIGKGDEVITTPYSFIASSNSILFEGATVVFADVDRQTYNIDPAEVEKKITSRTKAILGVDVFGRLADWPALRRIADANKLYLIEDSCEAFGTPGVGKHADACTFAFYPNKQITSGEGGVVVTANQQLADQCRQMRNQGRSLVDTDAFDVLGYNYRLTDVAAAMLLTQMRRFEEIQSKRQAVISWYCANLTDSPLRLPVDYLGDEVSWFVYVVELPSKVPAEAKQTIITTLRQQGIGAGYYFQPIHLQPLYRQRFGYRGGEFAHCEYLGQRTIALPFSSLLTRAQVDRVCGALLNILRELKIGV